jgi:hypothetical protein
MRSPNTLLLSGSGKGRVIATWTVLVVAALIAALVLNWTAWMRYYRTEDDTSNGIERGVAILLVLGGFLVWCGGLVVIGVVLEVLERRRGSELADTPSRRDPGHARGFLPKAGSGRPPYDGKWPG